MRNTKDLMLNKLAVIHKDAEVEVGSETRPLLFGPARSPETFMLTVSATKGSLLSSQS